jgi:hypothetical protein
VGGLEFQPARYHGGALYCLEHPSTGWPLAEVCVGVAAILFGTYSGMSLALPWGLDAYAALLVGGGTLILVLLFMGRVLGWQLRTKDGPLDLA